MLYYMLGRTLIERLMYMKITQETIQYVAALSKLKVADEDRPKLTKELEKILDYVETMNELDTEGIEPMSHVLPIYNVFREDEHHEGHSRDELLNNAPMKKDGCFVVPRTVE